MKTTISVIKADVGSIGGHIKPSAKLKAAIENGTFKVDPQAIAKRLVEGG